MSKRHHYVSGSGMVGCLYDGGPDQHATKREAIDWLTRRFADDLSLRAVRRMRADLHLHGIHHFGIHRPEAGADYCEITRFDGPMSEESES